MICAHPFCNGRHDGRYRIHELCPAAAEKRRASWRSYDGRLRDRQWETFTARQSDPSVVVDTRSHKRIFYKMQWALARRMAANETKLSAMYSEGGWTFLGKQQTTQQTTNMPGVFWHLLEGDAALERQK